MLCKKCGHQKGLVHNCPKLDNPWLWLIVGVMMCVVAFGFAVKANAEEYQSKDLVTCYELEDLKSIMDTANEGDQKKLNSLMGELYSQDKCFVILINFPSVIQDEDILYIQRDGKMMIVAIRVILPMGIPAYSVISGTPRLKGKSI